MIRVATDRDCERFAEIHAESFTDFWSAAALRSLLADDGVTALAVDDGFIVLRIVADEAEILTFAVLPGARGAGIGRALAAAAVEVAQKLGVQKLFLEVSQMNAPARHLYAALGFTEIGRRARYYPDGADALTLALTLT